MNLRQILLGGAVMLIVAGAAPAAVQTQTVDYKDGETTLKGFIAYDDAAKGAMPGVLVVPEWWGLNDFAKDKAKELAQMGYFAFAVDMYGDGMVAKTSKEAGELASKFRKDPPLMRRRITAALDAMKADKRVDAKKLAAIGFCFGGTTVLELARSGADIKGVVSFHGGLDTSKPAEAKAVKAKVLVQTGADDPSVPPPMVTAFEDEMRKAGVDYYVIAYGGAVHSFTNPASGNDPSKGVAYNEAAAKRSWQAMKDFFGEIFGK